MSNLSGSGLLKGTLGRGGGTPSDVYWDDILNKPDFADVATSGSYNDLTDKPNVMTGATEQLNGSLGFVPQPLAGDQNKFLNGAGAWVTPQSSGVNYSTDEQVIGTWIDGKPLYRRVVPIVVNLTFNTWVQVSELDSLNMDICVNATIMNSNKNTTNAITIDTNASPNEVLYMRSTGSFTTNYFILEYTKTTDIIGG